MVAAVHIFHHDCCSHGQLASESSGNLSGGSDNKLNDLEMEKFEKK